MKRREATLSNRNFFIYGIKQSKSRQNLPNTYWNERKPTRKQFYSTQKTKHELKLADTTKNNFEQLQTTWNNTKQRNANYK